MKRYLFLLLFISVMIPSFGWGVTGHRAIGLVAELHLSKRAFKTIRTILGQETLPVASTWMDEVRSDPTYDYAADWHWVTIETGNTYNQSEKNPNGDIIMTIERLVAELKSGVLPPEKEVEALRMLVHLVGDIHQPLHVGCCDDQGGSGAAVKWFGVSTNLHSVWDSRMIDDTKLSYTELAMSLIVPDKNTALAWQSASVLQWAEESMRFRENVYDIGDGNLGYAYAYHHKPIIEEQLAKAGVRLAGILNEIYG